MADENELVKIRGSVKGIITRMETYLEDHTSLSPSEVIVRQEKLKEAWDRFEDIQGKLEELDPAKHGEKDRMQFEEHYFQVMAKLETYAPRASPVNRSTNRQSVDSIGTMQSNTSLPKITIPVFSGEYRDWRNFHDLYVTIIHNNDSITPIHKLNYLKGSLKGEAQKIIQSVPQSGENYNEAWELLVERYENKQFNMNIHLGAILEQPSVTRDSFSGLRNLLNETKQHLAALKSLNLPVEQWDVIIIYLVSKKLDSATRREWELSKNKSDVPTLKSFYEFLEKRCTALELIQGPPDKEKKSRNVLLNFKSNATGNCKLCKGKQHPLYACETFIKSNVDERIKAVKTTGVCYNCLRSGHSVKDCHSRCCGKCNQKHNTMLHIESTLQETSQSSSQPTRRNENCESRNKPESSLALTTVATYHTVKQFTEVLLPTVLVKVKDNYGNWKQYKALLDSGSQCNFASIKLLEHLKIQPHKEELPIKGINGMKGAVEATAWLQIASSNERYNRKLEFWILDHITSALPQQHCNVESWNIPANIQLADPTFNTPGEIDMLLGAEVFFEVLRQGRVKLDDKLPTMHNTVFGWILCGGIASNYRAPKQTFLVRNDTLAKNLTRFWEVESVPERSPLTKEEKACEAHFAETIRRNEDGRYIVKLPLKNNDQELGDSYHAAYKQFIMLEKRLNRNPDLYKQYCNFMEEYQTLDHMEVVEEPNKSRRTFYLPHHPVLKESSSTTKLRVVFNGSMPTTTGISLNNQLMVGPVVHEELFSIIMRFRCYRIAMTADIIKMYRQILVDKSDRDLQRILWRKQQTEELKVYRLKTVTYGTASAPYQATKCIQQLAEDENMTAETRFAIKHNLYVDDFLGGADSVDEAIQLQNELIHVLKKGGLELHKWSSNTTNILENVSTERREGKHSLTIGENSVKALGLTWKPVEDQLTFTIDMKNYVTEQITKRIVLSEIASIFDPLGILGPVVTKAKIFIQQLWKENSDWDEPLNQKLAHEWSNMRTELNQFKDFAIDRLITQPEQIINAQIHGFSDASEVAYGACVYLRTTTNQGNVNIQLITSKSRVAPIKQITLPRLELCGAVVLSRLVNKVRTSLNVNIDNIYLWSDSTIVLSWLKSLPTRWKTFIANRVSEIQELTEESCCWKHIRSQDNPADGLSRGQTVREFTEYQSMWIHGPTWLKLDESEWPIQDYINTTIDIPEQKTKPIIINVAECQTEDITSRFSSVTKLNRVVAYCYRFINNVRKNTIKRRGPLSAKEITYAHQVIIKNVQHKEFEQEIYLLKNKQELKSNSNLKSLNPFIDDQGILRVGGRLLNANVNYSTKHQVLLPAKHIFTKLIIEREHKKLLHAGPQATLASIREYYWPLNARNTVKQVIHKCIRCFRYKAHESHQLMANLPAVRVQQNRPFLNSGVDYAGPIYLKQGKRKNATQVKGYIAVFVCLSTKATHLELVSSLTTESFLQAFKRFISRRGKCANVYSDNATNFKGAKNELNALHHLFKQEENRTKIINEAANNGINWKFIPPNAPHHGGIWEAAVKSVKHHLRRTIGNTKLSFEDMSTLLIEIEACLNSRPLYPMSNDPNDLTSLTPGHFLIGQPLTTNPEPDLTKLPINTLSRYQHLQRLFQHFWKRWSREYLTQLQQRSKWKEDQANIQPNNLVLVKEDNTTPLSWKLARIKEVHPGSDGRVRVATIVCESGTFVRPITKLCLLPSN